MGIMSKSQKNQKDDEEKISVVLDIMVLGIGAAIPFAIIDILRTGILEGVNLGFFIFWFLFVVGIGGFVILGILRKKFKFMQNPDKNVRIGYVKLLFLKFLVGVFIETFFFTVWEFRNHLLKVEADEVDFFEFTPELEVFFISLICIFALIIVFRYRVKDFIYKIEKLGG